MIINAGDAGTAWSGGDEWLDEQISHGSEAGFCLGGGFVGVGKPSAAAGRTVFQLADVLGVDKEQGFTLSRISIIQNRQTATLLHRTFQG